VIKLKRIGKETTMPENTTNRPVRVGFFTTVEQADKAVRDLLVAGFTKEQVSVICPDQHKHHFATNVSRADPPAAHAGGEITEGAAVGAALGGIALVATTIATGGAGLLAIPVFIGGGAFAGGFSSLIVSDGYGTGVGEYYEDAIHEGKIVVGVEVESADPTPRLEEAERILTNAGAELLAPRET
jgi:hypothetical protein